MKFNEFGILITAFENVSQVLENVRYIRKNFKEINKCQIVVISTTDKEEVKNRFTNLLYTEGLQPIIVKVLDNVPGNAGIKWKNREQSYISWRHEFIGPRVLRSMQEGFYLLLDAGVNYALHLHSDTTWKAEQEELLLKEINEVKNIYGIVDLCEEDNLDVLPIGFHWHPEGMVLNIKALDIFRALDWSKAFEKEDYSKSGYEEFSSHNYGSPEANLAQWVHYKMFGRCINHNRDLPDPRFYQRFRFRMTRPYHGDFEHIVNLEGVQ